MSGNSSPTPQIDPTLPDATKPTNLSGTALLKSAVDKISSHHVKHPDHLSSHADRHVSIQLSQLGEEDGLRSPMEADTDLKDTKEELVKLIKAARKGDLEEIKALLTKPEYMNVVHEPDGYDKYTILMWAAMYGQRDVVEYLYQQNLVDVNKEGGWNNTTALIRAVERGRLEVVKLLITYHADVNKATKGGMTALMLVAEIKETLYEGRPYLTIIDELIKSGADVNAKNFDGYTALNLAATEGNARVVERLLQVQDIKIDEPNKFGKTAFFNACEFGMFDCVKILQKSGANVNHKSNRGATPIMLAAVKQREEIVQWLLTSNPRADLTIKIPTDNILSMACSGGNKKIIEMVIEADPEVCSKDYAEVVLVAVCKNATCKKDIVDLLFSKLREANKSTTTYSEGQSSPRCDSILDLIRKRDGDGNSCFMHACNVGQSEILCALLEELYPDNQPCSTPIEEIDELFKVKNSTGCNAVTLLANHFKDTIDNAGDDFDSLPPDGRFSSQDEQKPSIRVFLSLAIKYNYKWPFLLEMLKYILPHLKSPISLIHKYGEYIKNGLHYGDFYAQKFTPNASVSDLNLVGALVSMAAALKLSAEKNSVEFDALTEEVEEYENMIKRCMDCQCIENPLNVTKMMLREQHLDPNQNLIHKARAFLHGPLKLCIEHDLTKLLATPAIRKHVEDVFSESLKERIVESIGSISDLVQLRSGCATYRYCPVVMFSFESLMKVIFLVLVMIAIALEASHETCENINQSQHYLSWFYFKMYCMDLQNIKSWIVVMLITSWLYEFGEILNRVKHFDSESVVENILKIGSEASDHFNDQWNLIDLGTVVFVTVWSYFSYISVNADFAQTFLCFSAISLSIGILKFLSKWQHTGQLVIMYFAMLRDVAPFLFVFLIFVLGFGIALHGMFPEKSFGSVGLTFLTLFDAALGQHEFEVFDGQDPFVQFVGSSLMVLYIVFVMIVLLNLIVARMSSTHDKISDNAVEIWSKVQAKNVDEFVMIYDRNPLCMLPAPLNLFPILVASLEFAVSAAGFMPCLESPEDKSILSITGSACDVVTSLIFSPWGAFQELSLALRAVNESSMPRNSQLFLWAMFLLLSPAWLIFFWLEILHSMFYECGTYLLNTRLKAIKIDSSHKTAFTLSKRYAHMNFVISGFIFKFVAPYFGIPRILATIWFGILGSVTSCLSIDVPRKRSLVHYCLYQESTKSIISGLIKTWVPSSKDPKVMEIYFKNICFLAYVLFGATLCFLNVEIVAAVVCPFLMDYLNNDPWYERIPAVSQSSKADVHDSNSPRLNNTHPTSSANGGTTTGEGTTEKKPQRLTVKRQSMSAMVATDSSKNVQGNMKFATVAYVAHFATRLQDKTHMRMSQCRTKKRVEQASPTVLNLSIIRGEFNKLGSNVFGAKANPYVIVYYPKPIKPLSGTDDDDIQWEKGKPVYKGGISPSFNMNDLKIEIIKGQYTLLFEVLDKNDMRVALNQDRLLLHKTVDIKEWIANKRYEGKVLLDDAYDMPATLINSDGVQTHDNIQVAAKIIYSSSRPTLGTHESVRQGDLYSNSTNNSPAPPKSDVSPRPKEVISNKANNNKSPPDGDKDKDYPLHLSVPADENASSTQSRRNSFASTETPELPRLLFTQEDREKIFLSKEEQEKLIREREQQQQQQQNKDTRSRSGDARSGSTTPVGGPLEELTKELL